MAATKERGLRVVSRGFGLLKDKEKREGRRITFDTMTAETGLAKMTVRRFTAADAGDVSGSPVDAAAVMADYLGVGLGDLLDVQRDAGEGTGQ